MAPTKKTKLKISLHQKAKRSSSFSSGSSEEEGGRWPQSQAVDPEPTPTKFRTLARLLAKQDPKNEMADKSNGREQVPSSVEIDSPSTEDSLMNDPCYGEEKSSIDPRLVETTSTGRESSDIPNRGSGSEGAKSMPPRGSPSEAKARAVLTRVASLRPQDRLEMAKSITMDIFTSVVVDENENKTWQEENGPSLSTSAAFNFHASTRSADCDGPPEPEPKKTLHFAPRVRVLKTIHINDYTREEMDATWGTEEDHERNKRDLADTVRRMRASTQGECKCSDDDDDQEGELCPRGLEYMRSPDELERRKLRRQRIVDAVLDEQDRQWMENEHNSREIADASGFNSASARILALDLASSDAKYVYARRRSSMLRNTNDGGMRVGRRRSSIISNVGRRRSSLVSYEKHNDAVMEELMELERQAELEDEECPAESKFDAVDYEMQGGSEDLHVVKQKCVISHIGRGFRGIFAWQNKDREYCSVGTKDFRSPAEESMDIEDSLHVARKRLGTDGMSTVLDDDCSSTDSCSVDELRDVPTELTRH